MQPMNDASDGCCLLAPVYLIAAIFRAIFSPFNPEDGNARYEGEPMKKR